MLDRAAAPQHKKQKPPLPEPWPSSCEHVSPAESNPASPADGPPSRRPSRYCRPALAGARGFRWRVHPTRGTVAGGRAPWLKGDLHSYCKCPGRQALDACRWILRRWSRDAAAPGQSPIPSLPSWACRTRRASTRVAPALLEAPRARVSSSQTLISTQDSVIDETPDQVGPDLHRSRPGET